MATQRVEDVQIALTREGYRRNVDLAKTIVAIACSFLAGFFGVLRSEHQSANLTPSLGQEFLMGVLTSVIAILVSALALHLLSSRKSGVPARQGEVRPENVGEVLVYAVCASNRFFGGIPTDGTVRLADSQLLFDSSDYCFQVGKAQISKCEWGSGHLSISVLADHPDLKNVVTLRPRRGCKSDSAKLRAMVERIKTLPDSDEPVVLPPLTVREFGFSFSNTWDVVLWSVPVNFVVWFLAARLWMLSVPLHHSLTVATLGAIQGLVMGSLLRVVIHHVEKRHADGLVKLGLDRPKIEPG